MIPERGKEKEQMFLQSRINLNNKKQYGQVIWYRYLWVD